MEKKKKKESFDLKPTSAITPDKSTLQTSMLSFH